MHRNFAEVGMWRGLWDPQKQTDRQTDRQIDRQTDRHTDTLADPKTHSISLPHWGQSNKSKSAQRVIQNTGSSDTVQSKINKDKYVNILAKECKCQQLHTDDFGRTQAMDVWLATGGIHLSVPLHSRIPHPTVTFHPILHPSCYFPLTCASEIQLEDQGNAMGGTWDVINFCKWLLC